VYFIRITDTHGNAQLFDLGAPGINVEYGFEKDQDQRGFFSRRNPIPSTQGKPSQSSEQLNMSEIIGASSSQPRLHIKENQSQRNNEIQMQENSAASTSNREMMEVPAISGVIVESETVEKILDIMYILFAPRETEDPFSLSERESPRRTSDNILERRGEQIIDEEGEARNEVIETKGGSIVTTVEGAQYFVPKVSNTEVDADLGKRSPLSKDGAISNGSPQNTINNQFNINNNNNINNETNINNNNETNINNNINTENNLYNESNLNKETNINNDSNINNQGNINSQNQNNPEKNDESNDAI
jgi:hypothetical protein